MAVCPASQQLVAETQSIELGHHVELAPAHAVGVISVHVWPPSVVSAIVGWSFQPAPAAQHTLVLTQDTDLTSIEVGMSV